MKDIRILLCDDHSLLRKGIKSLFDESVGYFVVGEASNGKEMILKYNELLPDIIIADISMPELTGPDALKKLRIRYPGVRVLFISMYLGEQYIYIVLQAGGKGLIGKNLEKGELQFAVNQILAGGKYFGPLYDDDKLDAIIDKYSGKSSKTILQMTEEPTETEIQILLYLADGLTSEQIAQKMGLAKRTIDSYRSNIINKFNLKTKQDLIKFAVLFSESRKL
jgi:DNA-binding NarL/FixJ family response regulator